MQGQKWEIGCYGDGSLGHQHTRDACARVLQDAISIRGKARLIAGLLATDMSDDASEEHEACDWLNTYAPVDGATWGWQDGDFGLWPNEEEPGRGGLLTLDCARNGAITGGPAADDCDKEE